MFLEKNIQEGRQFCAVYRDHRKSAQICGSQRALSQKQSSKKTSSFVSGIRHQQASPKKHHLGDGGLLNCLIILHEHLQLTTHHPY